MGWVCVTDSSTAAVDAGAEVLFPGRLAEDVMFLEFQC